MSELKIIESGAIASADAVADLVGADAGKGVSQARDDKFYPLVSVLHKLSPQVDQSDGRYIAGAKPGSIWLRNFEVEIVDGDQGVVVQPVMMYTEYVAWVPRE